MSRFALQIYAILLFMGAVPLLASAILLSEVLTFNDDLQEEAVSTINDVALFHRAWAESEADRVTLIGESLAGSRELNALDLTTPDGLARAEARLQSAADRYDVLRKVEVVVDDAVVLEVSQADMPALEELKMRKRSWSIAETPNARPGPDTSRLLRLSFGIDRSFAERYDVLGEKRDLHRMLAAVEDEQSGSISEVYRTFYYLMLALVVVLTVAFAVLITTPISRRVARLAKATRDVAKGDLSVRVPVKGGGELAQLTEQFNNMVSELGENRRKLGYLERMSAWQQVARRLAHEIKNPLTPLLLAIQQLDKTFDMYRRDPDRYRLVVSDVVEIVTEEVEALRLLTQEFSEFARLPQPNPEPRDVWGFVEQTLRSNPQFQDTADMVELGGPELLARLDPPLMRRVLVNVVQNAIEAVNEAGDDRPEIEVSLELADDGEMARIIVSDNGPGLTREQIDRVFEPYFTTKATGTGLGMAIVRKIVLDHGGDIRIWNREGERSGAVVWVELPVLTRDQAQKLASNATAIGTVDDDMSQSTDGSALDEPHVTVEDGPDEDEPDTTGEDEPDKNDEDEPDKNDDEAPVWADSDQTESV